MRQKRITAMLLSLCLLFAMLPTAVLAADPPPMISIPSGSVWKGSVFGDLGGTPNSTNFGVTEKSGGSVTLMAKGGKGKIKTSSPSSEGLAYYYQEVSPQDNFELKAKATVDVWTSATDAQQSFGIMLRNGILDNLSQSGYSGEYLAAGAIDNRLQVFYKNSITDAVAKNMFSDVNAPSGGQSYDISIQKSGSVYKLTVNGETQVLPQQLTSSFNFVGLYVARNTTVTFTDVSFHKDNRAPSSISVDASAFKKSYFVGDSLDLNGLKVTAAFPDLHEEILAAGDFIVDGFSSKTEGDHSLTIYYNGQSAAVPGTIHVAPRVVTALDVQYMPAKTDYYPGDHLDTQGMVVQAQYNGGGDWATLGSNEYTLSLPSTDASYSVTTATYTLMTPGVTTVTVRSTVTTDTYTSFDVNVNNAELTTLEITHAPNKTSYFVGDTFDQAGLVVTARYSNGASVKLLRSEYNVELTDGGLATPGAKSLTVTSYKKASLVSAPVTITVATPAVTHVAVTTYPTTTFAVGQEIDLTGMKVSAVYDNKAKAELAASEYYVDTTAYNKSQPGTYNVVITPHNTALPAVQLPVTVKAAYAPEWKSIRFGQSTSDANNKIEVLSPDSVRLTALEGGGKVTGDHDGISFYYVELDPTKDNFTLSANIKVTAFAKDQYDGQESFGIMARDAIGTAGDSSIFASNIAAVGGYSGGTTKPIGTQLFIRTGVDAPNAGSAGVQSKMLSSVRPTTSNTYPAANYKLTLTKTNSGFTGSLNGSEPVKFYAPDIMSVQGTDTMYVGFYTARLATIEVSGIDLKVSAAATDAPIEMPPADPTAPAFSFTSLTRTSNPIYNLTMNANVAGKVTIKQGASVLGTELPMTAGTTLTVPTTVTANTYTNFSAVFVPDDAQYLTSYDKIVQNHTVTMKTFAVGGDIYAAPSGTSDGDGTAQHPLDLDTAVDYVAAGQKIVLLDGRYERSGKLDIKKGNDGTAGAHKYLVAAPGAKPILDFAKKSEGVVLSGSYWHVKGIDVTRSASNTKGFTVGGSNNIVEGSRFYANGDTGLQISRTDESAPRAEWPSNNLILNCESFDNVDPSNNNADGFAAKLTAGSGNIFRGDISHNNIDDGWDLYTKAGTGAIGAVLIEDSIAYNNGVLTDGTVGAGDKNGFKLGGEGIHVPHVIRGSIAFGNGAYGFSSNSNPGVRVEATNIGFNNAKGNLNLTSYTGVTLDFALDGFISYQKNYTAKDNYPASLNSATNYLWNGTKSVNKLGQQLSDANFASLAPVIPYERDASGAIIKGLFLRYIPTVVDNGSGGGGGGAPDPVTAVDGGVRITGTPTIENVGGQDVASLRLDMATLDKALQLLAKQPAGANTVNVEVSGSTASAQVIVPGSALQSAEGGTQLAVSAQGVSYVLPLGAVDVAQAAKELGVEASSVDIRIALTQVSGAQKEKIAALSKTNGGTLLGEPYEFSVTVEAGGKQVQVNDFGTLYVTRSLTLEGKVDSGSATAVWIDETTGTMNFVPATFAVIDGNTVVTMKRPGNSVYAVVQSVRSFDDIARHWSQKDVERLAAKLVVQGVSARSFAPDAAVTRAEFAALLVRALGLNAAAGSAAFQDVAASDWYAGVVATAAKHGLVQGFEDGRFQPDARITREQMAVMVARAVALTGATVKTQAAPQFADRAAISLWSRDAVDQIVGAGIAQGVSGGRFAPGAEATRGEAAVMLGRMLEAVQFMN